jgi:hypothetical protein
MPPTPTHTSRAGDGPDWTGDPAVIAHLRSHGVLEEADKVFDYLDQIDTYRARIAALTVENHRLADLLANLLAEPAQVALREVVAEQLDVAAWLAANRPEAPAATGDTAPTNTPRHPRRRTQQETTRQ